MPESGFWHEVQVVCSQGCRVGESLAWPFHISRFPVGLVPPPDSCEIRTGNGISALGNNQISGYHKPVKSLKVVLYGEPVLKARSEGAFRCLSSAASSPYESARNNLTLDAVRVTKDGAWSTAWLWNWLVADPEQRSRSCWNVPPSRTTWSPGVCQDVAP